MNLPPVLPGPNRGRKILLIVLVMLAVVVSLPLLAWAIYRENGRRRVEVEIAAIRRTGEPVTWEELDRWYVEPPAGQNAAGIYTQAFAHLVELHPAPTNLPVVGMAKLPEPGDPLPVEMRTVIADCLQTNAAALEILHQASSGRGGRYPVDLTKGIAALLPHLTKLRRAAQMLMLEAILSTEDGRADQAQRALTAGFAVGSSLRKEPILISRLVAIAINGLMLTGLEQCVNRVAFTDAQLAELMTALADAKSDPSMARAMAGERAFGCGLFGQIRAGKLKFEEFFGEDYTRRRALLINSYRVSGRAEHEEAYYLQVMADYVAAVRRSLRERVPAAEAIEERFDHIPRYYMICQILLPGLSFAVAKDVKDLAQLEVARTALAIERYRLAQGKLPSALGDLVPAYLDAVQVDPFDGQPLRYKPLATGFVVYSVGGDGKDDGGRAKTDKGAVSQPGTDITFTVVR